MKNTLNISRRGLLKSGGALIVSFAFGGGVGDGLLAQGSPGMDLDSFITVHPDGKVTLFTSRVDPGTGLRTAYAQITAEEMGIPVERVRVIDGDTAVVPNHGGTGGSSGVPRGGADIRSAAATARKALLDLGSKRLGKPAGELTIVGGNVQPVSGGAGVSVAELIGGKRFELTVDPTASVRNPSSYSIVGKPVLRADVPGKATGKFVYVHDHKLPGMLHGRVVRPTVIGANLLTVDEASISKIPEVKVVRIENFLGVVAKDEWAAIRAARELKVTWGEGKVFPTTSVALAGQMRETNAELEQQAINKGDVAAGLGAAAQKLSASYYWPFHSHASMGPSCSVADVKDSGVTVWSSTQDVFGVRGAVAKALAVPPAKVRVVYLDGSGSYGSNGAYDAAHDAALLSRAVGQPVRLQWSRQDELVWDPKGPAQLLDVRGGVDKDGNIVAWESSATGPAGPQWTGSPLATVAAGLAQAAPQGQGVPVVQNLDPGYAMPNMRITGRQLKDTPLRLSNLRAPGKIGTIFAVESFMDELAAATASDPIAFRKKGLSDPRALAVIDRAAQMIGWKPRTSPGPRAKGNKLTGRGMAYMRYKHAENYVAIAMDVEVDRESGKIRVQRITCAHDCGLIINPDGLRNQVEGNILQTLSRTLHEEVTFDKARVTSVDWVSYPLLRFPDVPAIEVALIDHPDQPPYGAGEAACAPLAAAVANAVFDATGVRLREVPFTAAKVKAALAKG